MGRAFAINNPHVVAETIDGETILIHLGTGTYYSLDGVAAEVWELLVGGTEESEALEVIESRYESETGGVEPSVSALVEELLAEGLLIDAPASGVPAEPHMQEPGAGSAFVPPVLHKYTDMQEFMLVDPIHDVDAEAGWPHVKAG